MGVARDTEFDISSDGEQGYRKAKEVDDDAVVMDVQMPIMDGIQTIKKLRQESYHQPVDREELITMLVRYQNPSR